MGVRVPLGVPDYERFYIMTMRDDKRLDKMIRDSEKSWNNMIVFHRDEGSDWFPFHGVLRKGDGTFIKRIVINA